MGSQTLSLPKETQPNIVVSVGQRENWGESNMADASPRTDTSTDDTDDRNQRVIIFYFQYSVYFASKFYLGKIKDFKMLLSFILIVGIKKRI